MFILTKRQLLAEFIWNNLLQKVLKSWCKVPMMELLFAKQWLYNGYFHPSKHSSWWRRTEVALQTSWRCLQCNIFLSSKTSWRRLEDIIARRLVNTSWRRFRKMYCKYVLKTSWRQETFAGKEFYRIFITC